MWLLAISVCCSVAVGILFKVFHLGERQLYSAIAVGYVVCSVLSFSLLNPTIEVEKIEGKTLAIVFVLSILMPSGFVVIKKSVAGNGIAKTDVVQRMSIIMPIVASYFLFGEKFFPTKTIAVILGLCSIALMMSRESEQKTAEKNWQLIYIFIVFGVVDILFKTITSMDFKDIISMVFFCCSVVMILYSMARGFSLRAMSVGFGLALGVLNFTNIYTYLLAHKVMKDSPVVVFTSMNLGVITLGMLCGVFFFGEKINKKNIVGILCAALSVVLLNIKA